MKRTVVTLTLTLIVGIVIGLVGNHLLIAQPKPVKRTVLLNRTALAGMEGKEGIMYILEIAPGVKVPRHSHPGHEFAYLLEGSVTLATEGQQAAVLQPGEMAHLPPQRTHSGKNNSTTAPAKFVVFGVYEKGQPDTTFVK